MKIKKLNTDGELNYVVSSFCKSYQKSKIGKHLYKIDFALNAFLKISKMTNIILLKEDNIIKAWILHTDNNILYACGSIANIGLLEKKIKLEVKNSLSMFYMPRAKGWLGFESRF